MAKAESSAGQVLSPAEVDEYLMYHNQQLPLPDKFANVTVTSSVQGLTYRYATEEQLKAASDEAAANLKASEADAARNKAAREAAMKANAEAVNRVVVPQMPPSQTP
jgi:topoisomerase IA-like protein